MDMDEPVPLHPALDAPSPVVLTTLPPHPCVYLPGREATLRAFSARNMPELVYHDFLNASFRRSGLVIYQPVCGDCRECVPLRVLVRRFHPGKSQRRCWRRNRDLIVTAGQPVATDEKFELYTRYQAIRHHSTKADSRASFEDFLYRSPIKTLEFTYRDGWGRLLAVGICDVCPKSLSSVYFSSNRCNPIAGWEHLGRYTKLISLRGGQSPIIIWGIGSKTAGKWRTKPISDRMKFSAPMAAGTKMEPKKSLDRRQNVELS